MTSPCSTFTHTRLFPALLLTLFLLPPTNTPPHAYTGVYKPGTGSGTPSVTTPPGPTTTTTTPPTPPKPEPTASFPTKGPLAAVPGQSTFDGCGAGCALCMANDKSVCLACTDVKTYSNVAGKCVCGAGRGGSECAACEVGYYSTGGTLAEAMPSCKKCRPGFSTKEAGAKDVLECNGECLLCVCVCVLLGSMYLMQLEICCAHVLRTCCSVVVVSSY